MFCRPCKNKRFPVYLVLLQQEEKVRWSLLNVSGWWSAHLKGQVGDVDKLIVRE